MKKFAAVLALGLSVGAGLGAMVGWAVGTSSAMSTMKETKEYKTGAAVIAVWKEDERLKRSLEREFRALADDINAKFGAGTIILR